MEDLPNWVKAFNASDEVEKYKQIWSPLKPIDQYVESEDDNRTAERIFKGETTSTFPHNLPLIWDLNGQFSLLRETPFGNSMTTDFALAAIEGDERAPPTQDDTLVMKN